MTTTAGPNSGPLLVIEDDETIGVTAKQIFEDEGFGVSLCPSLAAARAHLEHTPMPICIVLDDVLGDGGAREFLAELCARNLVVPTVLCSASAHAPTLAKDYGIVWNQNLDSGGMVLGDEVEVTVNIEANKRKPEAAAPPVAK